MTTLIFIALAAIANAFMDITDAFHYISRLRNLNPNFWDKDTSSNNKWKNGRKKEGEAFFGSSTFLVFLTDAWHASKSIMIVYIAFAVIFYKPVFGIWDIGLVLIVWFVFFEATYRYLKTT